MAQVLESIDKEAKESFNQTIRYLLKMRAWRFVPRPYKIPVRHQYKEIK